MKSTLLIFIATIFAINVTASSVNPSESITIIEDKTVDVMIDKTSADLFLLSEYDAAESALEFTVVSDIRYIQIYNSNDELQYQLPVLSNKVKISQSLFSESGDYKLGFMIEGQDDIHFSIVNIK